MTTHRLPRETVEDFPIEVTLDDGQTITSGFTFALYRIGSTRPTTYQQPVVDGDKTAIHIEGLQPGAYAIRVRYDDGAERDSPDSIIIT